MHTIRTTIGSAAVLALALVPLAVQAQASRLTDINGMAPADAEGILTARGYSHVSTNRNSMGYRYSYWWNAADRQCVQVESHEHRIETVQDASGSDCGHSGHSGAGAAVGVVAGAAILGALLSHNSNHHGDNRHSNDSSYEDEFERGYTDGLHNAAYHNRNNADGYSNGYSSGVDERNANLRHHSGRGGYVEAAQIDDLQGARAAGGMDELDRRGFRQVDNFTSGNTRYSIQWRAASQQCVQVTVADGRFYDIRDIGSNPNCR